MNKGRALILDDEEIVRTSCQRVLEPAGYFVKTAASGKNGFTLLKTRLKENVAFSMTTQIQQTYALTETVDSEIIAEEAKKIFNDNSGQVLSILLNSVLMAQTVRHGSVLKVIFAFKIFQEYFLASYIVRENLSDNGYPFFCSEIRADKETEVCSKEDAYENA